MDSRLKHLKHMLVLLCIFIAACTALYDLRSHRDVINRPWRKLKLKPVQRLYGYSPYGLSSPNYASPIIYAIPPVPSTSILPTTPASSPIPNPPAYVPPRPPRASSSPPSPHALSPPPKHVPSPPVYGSAPPSGPSPPHNNKPQSGVWCVAKPAVPDSIIQAALDYACGSGADCKSIQPNGPCFQPNTLLSHASYAFNSYWQSRKVGGGTCDFGGTAMLVTADPSFGGCHFVFS